MNPATNKHRFSISNSCSEDWDKMPDVQIGKHCAVCEKNIYDLTDLDPNQLSELYQQNNGQLCGKIKISELDDNPVQSWIQRQLYWSRLKAFVIALIFVFGQQLFNVAPVYGQSNGTNVQEKEYTENVTVVEGQVVDENGEGIPFANVVLLKNETVIRGTPADIDGYFKISTNQTGSFDLKVAYLESITEIKGIILQEDMVLNVQEITVNTSFSLEWVGLIYYPPFIDPTKPESGTIIKREQIENNTRVK